MSAKEKAEVSARMKKYWAARRKEPIDPAQHACTDREHAAKRP